MSMKDQTNTGGPNVIKNPKSHGLPELWFVKKVAEERGISLQAALTLIRKNSMTVK